MSDKKIVQLKGRDIPQDEWDAMFGKSKKIFTVNVGDMSPIETLKLMRELRSNMTKSEVVFISPEMPAVNMDGGPICSEPCRCEPPHNGLCPCNNYGGER